MIPSVVGMARDIFLLQRGAFDVRLKSVSNMAQVPQFSATELSAPPKKKRRAIPMMSCHGRNTSHVPVTGSKKNPILIESDDENTQLRARKLSKVISWFSS